MSLPPGYPPVAAAVDAVAATTAEENGRDDPHLFRTNCFRGIFRSTPLTVPPEWIPLDFPAMISAIGNSSHDYLTVRIFSEAIAHPRDLLSSRNTVRTQSLSLSLSPDSKEPKPGAKMRDPFFLRASARHPGTAEQRERPTYLTRDCVCPTSSLSSTHQQAASLALARSLKRPSR